MAVSRRDHLDIDWFGPSGDTPSHNWWRPSPDGLAEELKTAQAILHFLEESLGLGPSGGHEDLWTWPPTREAPPDPWAALVSPQMNAAVEDLASEKPRRRLRLEWKVANRNAITQPITEFHFDHSVPGKLTIITPDADGPDPN